MAIIDGFPATSFDARDRKWVKDVASASGGLPDTTGASQGDVLTIGSDGPEWDAPSGGGGAQIFTIHINTEVDPDYAVTLETLNEIVSAIYAGKIIAVEGFSVQDVSVFAGAPADGTGYLNIIARSYTIISAEVGIACGIQTLNAYDISPSDYDDPVQMLYSDSVSAETVFGPPGD